MFTQDVTEAQSTREKYPPLLKGYPVLGVLPTFLRSPLQTLQDAQADYGEVVALNMAGEKYVLITNPAHIDHVLIQNHDNYTKGYGRARELLGNGVALAEGEHWRKQRRLIQPTFSRTKIDDLIGIIFDQTDVMITQWQDKVKTGTPVELLAETSRLTQRVIGKAVFGEDVQSAENIGAAFDQTLSGIELKLAAPEWFSRLRFLANKRFKRANAIIEEQMRQLITKRASQETGNDLMAMLLQARDEHTGQAMTFEQLRDEVTTIYLAGYETTSIALSWTLYLLAQNPAYAASVAHEAAMVVGDTPPNTDTVRQLKFTNSVLEESLRLYPPVYQFSRKAIKADYLGGYRIDPGTTILISPYVMHLKPEFWEAPNDFRPERFYEEGSKPVTTQHSYLPFGSGPRKCLGMNLALTEAAIVIACVAKNFELTYSHDAVPYPVPRATLKPNGPIRLSLAPRSTDQTTNTPV